MSSFDRPSPLLGEHNEDILVTALAYDSGRVQELQESGALT